MRDPLLRAFLRSRASNRKNLLLAGVIFDVNIVRPYRVGAGVMLVGVAIA